MGGVVTGVCGTYWARPSEPQSHHQHTQPSADSCHGRSLSSPRAVASDHSVIYRQRKCLKLTVLSNCSTLMRDFQLNKSINQSTAIDTRSKWFSYHVSGCFVHRPRAALMFRTCRKRSFYKPNPSTDSINLITHTVLTRSISSEYLQSVMMFGVTALTCG